jgi:hypothetical protein
MKQGAPSIAFFAMGGKACSPKLSYALFLSTDQAKNSPHPQFFANSLFPVP